jgi:hypothetical protein
VRRWIATGLLVFAVAPLTHSASTEAITLPSPSTETVWRAGAASADVTPPVGTFLAGYGRNRRSTGKLDPLMLRVVVIDDGLTPLAIMTLDNIGLTRPDVQRIQGRIHEVVPVIPPDQVIVSSTHTHAGPDVVGLWGESFWSSGRDENYLDGLLEIAAATTHLAWSARQPAQLRAATRKVPMPWVENRSEPGLLDQHLTTLALTNAAGASIATLTNYACHPTVLGAENTSTSADYVHGFVNAMSAAQPGEHLFLQGAIGGWVQPLQGDRSHQTAISIGQQLAEGALELLADAEPVPAEPIRFASASVDIPLANWGMRLLAFIGVMERDIDNGALRTSVARFTLGSVAFVTHPGETSPAYSLQSRQIIGGEHVVVMGLTQDAMGYILKPDYFENTDAYPHADYLTSVSAGAEAGPRLMEAIQKLNPE